MHGFNNRIFHFQDSWYKQYPWLHYSCNVHWYWQSRTPKHDNETVKVQFTYQVQASSKPGDQSHRQTNPKRGWLGIQSPKNRQAGSEQAD